MATEPDRTDQYWCPPFVRFPMGAERMLVYSPLTGERVCLPREAVPVLNACSRLATLDEHASQLQRLLPGTGDRAQAIERVLGWAIDRNLLLSRITLLRHSRESAMGGQVRRPSAPFPTPGIGTLAVLTHSRLDLLKACIRSYAEACVRHSRKVSFLICDDSRDLSYGEACRRFLAEARARWGFEMRYLGRPERAAFALRLKAMGCCTDDLAQFCLFGDERYGLSTGANRNALLLETAGELVLSVDDDTQCRTAVIPRTGGSPTALEVHEQPPLESWFYRTREAAIEAAEFVDIDLLGLHEKYLGGDLGELIRGGGNPGGAQMEHACGHLLTSLYRGNGSVALTFNGLVGDSATYVTGWRLNDTGPTKARVLASEAAYEVAAVSRNVLRGVPAPVICHGGPVMSATIGMDNRRVLPPFFPVLRNQDGVFGTVLHACSPDAFLCHTPIALLHVPEGTRPYAISRNAVVTRTRLSDLLCRFIGKTPLVSDDGGARMRELGQHLETLGRLAAPEFEQLATAGLAGESAALYEEIRRAVEEHPDPPAYWKRDVEAALEAIEAEAVSGQPLALEDVPNDGWDSALLRSQQIIGQYGSLLRSWADTVAAARELRSRGCELARRVS